MTWFNQMNGSFCFITYSVSIFEQSGANMSSNVSSIILAIVQIAGTLLAAQFVDRVGRKLLMAISLFGCTFGLTAMGIYVYLDECGVDVSMFNWIPVTSLAFVILISSTGISPLTMMYIVEILPAKVSVHFVHLFLFVVAKEISQKSIKLLFEGACVRLNRCLCNNQYFLIFYRKIFSIAH